MKLGKERILLYNVLKVIVLSWINSLSCKGSVIFPKYQIRCASSSSFVFKQLTSKMETNNIQIIHVICVQLYQRLVLSINLLKTGLATNLQCLQLLLNSRKIKTFSIVRVKRNRMRCIPVKKIQRRHQPVQGVVKPVCKTLAKNSSVQRIPLTLIK